jgi:hypothetical protein
MPEELCRKCGEQLKEYSHCVKCKEIIQRICTVCQRKTEEQYHHECVYQLYILKLFPIPPDKALERNKVLPNILIGNFGFMKK